MSQPHWMGGDCSFVSALESAATLGIAKTFSIYKPFGASSGFLEIEHPDDRISTMNLPVRARLGRTGPSSRAGTAWKASDPAPGNARPPLP